MGGIVFRANANNLTWALQTAACGRNLVCGDILSIKKKYYCTFMKNLKFGKM